MSEFARISLPVAGTGRGVFAKGVRAAGLLALALGATACSAAEEAERVQLPVVASAGGMLPLRTNLGYDVTFSEARVAIEDLEFAIAGEAHTASLWRRAAGLLIPSAHAHPGHYQGGDITGELPGHFILSWMPTSASQLGMATLIVGSYQSANFTFARCQPADAASGDDPLLGHTAVLRGEATRNGEVHAFRAVLDAPDDRQLVGAPFEAEIRSGSQATLSIELVPVDPLEGDTLLDDIDFARLPAGADGLVLLEESSAEPAIVEAYNDLRRAFQTHDHFSVRVDSGK